MIFKNLASVQNSTRLCRSRNSLVHKELNRYKRVPIRRRQFSAARGSGYFQDLRSGDCNNLSRTIVQHFCIIQRVLLSLHTLLNFNASTAI
jgi:hypothetical protein